MKDDILNILRNEDKSLDAYDIQHKLNITDTNSLEELLKVLNELEDENIIYHYVDILYENQADLGTEFKELLEDRKKTHFYPKFENSYNVLDYANKFISLINEFMRLDLPEDADDLIKIYAEKWVYLCIAENCITTTYDEP